MRKVWYIVLGWIVVFSLLFMLGEAMGWLTPQAVERLIGQSRQSLAGQLASTGTIIGLLTIDLLLPVPSSLVMVLSGKLLGTWWGGLVSFAGAMLAAAIGFGACRWQGQRAFRKLVGETDVEAVSRWFDRYGVYAIILSRPVPMLTELLSCLAGLSRMSAWRFYLASILGTAPICFIYSWAGGREGSGSSWLAIWLALGIPALGWLFVRRLKGESEPDPSMET